MKQSLPLIIYNLNTQGSQTKGWVDERTYCSHFTEKSSSPVLHTQGKTKYYKRCVLLWCQTLQSWSFPKNKNLELWTECVSIRGVWILFKTGWNRRLKILIGKLVTLTDFLLQALFHLLNFKLMVLNSLCTFALINIHVCPRPENPKSQRERLQIGDSGLTAYVLK